MINPYFLRREKKDVFQNKESPKKAEDPNDNKENKPVSSPSKFALKAKKIDLVVWLQISDAQKEVYEQFIKSEEVQSVLFFEISSIGIKQIRVTFSLFNGLKEDL